MCKNWFRIISAKDGKVKEVCGYTETYNVNGQQIEIGYDKRGNKWYATDLETGTGAYIRPERTRARMREIVSNYIYLRGILAIKASNAEHVNKCKQTLADYKYNTEVAGEIEI